MIQHGLTFLLPPAPLIRTLNMWCCLYTVNVFDIFDIFSIVESRKEKSRDAARHRRGQENHEFTELSKLLPLPPDITSQQPLHNDLHSDLHDDLQNDLHSDLDSDLHKRITSLLSCQSCCRCLQTSPASIHFTVTLTMTFTRESRIY